MTQRRHKRTEVTSQPKNSEYEFCECENERPNKVSTTILSNFSSRPLCSLSHRCGREQMKKKNDNCLPSLFLMALSRKPEEKHKHKHIHIHTHAIRYPPFDQLCEGTVVAVFSIVFQIGFFSLSFRSSSPLWIFGLFAECDIRRRHIFNETTQNTQNGDIEIAQ